MLLDYSLTMGSGGGFKAMPFSNGNSRRRSGLLTMFLGANGEGQDRHFSSPRTARQKKRTTLNTVDP